MKHIFIVNPISGKGKTLKTVDRIKKVCEEEHLDYEIHYTEYPQEATKIARKYRFTKNIIYSVGGDGTLNEVLNGIVGTKNLLGVIPSGSGNDFYKTLSKIDEEYPVIDIQPHWLIFDKVLNEEYLLMEYNILLFFYQYKKLNL